VSHHTQFWVISQAILTASHWRKNNQYRKWSQFPTCTGWWKGKANLWTGIVAWPANEKKPDKNYSP